MSRFQQNLLYLAVLVIVFVIFNIFFPNNEQFYPCGVFLPNPISSDVNILSINLNKVIDYDTKLQHYKSYTKKFDSSVPIGSINVMTHVKSKNKFYHACKKCATKAFKLATENGSDKIKYYCFYPQGNLNELSVVRLKADVFRS